MTVYTSSGNISIPSTVSKIKVVMKGEGGLGADVTVYNCQRWTGSIPSGYPNGACFNTLAGSGGDTTFLNTTAGGGKGGAYGSTGGSGGPGGTYSVPAGLITASNGNNGGPNTNNTTNVGGSGPGGAGTNGSSSAYTYTGITYDACDNPGGTSQYCANNCCTNDCGFVGGVATSSSPPYRLVCRCSYKNSGTCYGAGGGAGAYVEFELTNQELSSLGYLGTIQSYTVNEGDSNLNNGSIEIVLFFTDVYIKTSLGWQLVKNIYVNQSEVGIGWTTSIANPKNYGW